MDERLKLYGFNNLTKALSFNIYDVCYAKTPREQKEYIAYIDQQYNSERLTDILTHVVEMIGAKILHISRQDYDPQVLRSRFWWRRNRRFRWSLPGRRFWHIWIRAM